MDPVFRLQSILVRYLRGALTLAQFEREFVPFVPYFAERPQGEVSARLAMAVDELLVDISTHEATEDDLRALLESMRTSSPTAEIRSPGSVLSSSDSQTTHFYVTMSAFTSIATGQAVEGQVAGDHRPLLEASA